VISDSNSGGGRKKPGNRGKKCNAHTAQERVEYVAQLLASGHDSRQVRRALQKAPHNLAPRQIAEYVTRARDWILKTAAGITKVEAIGEAVTFYRTVIADPKVETRDRIDARKQLDLIFGVHAPRALAVREIPLPPAPPQNETEGAKMFAPHIVYALELSYGQEETTAAIEIASRIEKDAKPPAPAKPTKKLKLA
jgi:hypothetical protein